MMKKIIISQLAVVLLLVSCHNSDNASTFSEQLKNEISAIETEGDFKSGKGYLDESVSNELALTKSANYAFSADGAVGGSESKGNGKVNTESISKHTYNSKIIRTADLKLKVNDVKKVSAKIANLVDMNGGYVSSENLSSDKNYYQKIKSTEDFEINEYEIITSNLIYVRVPSENFQSVLSAIKGVSLSEDYIKINTQDVSEEYVDLETRLRTKKEVEARYIEILRSKAKTLEDILVAEDKIRVIREEIEVVEGRLNFLKNKVGLSTIQIDIYEDAKYIQEQVKLNNYTTSDWSFGEKVLDSVSSGWNGILWFLIGVLYFWPFFLVGGVVFWIIRRRLKKKK